MSPSARTTLNRARKEKLQAARKILRELGFASKQHNEVGAFTLLALLDLGPNEPWNKARAPLLGITPIIEFIRRSYGPHYAPNTRETIRDEAVKHFVGHGLAVRNPDDAKRPPN